MAATGCIHGKSRARRILLMLFEMAVRGKPNDFIIPFFVSTLVDWLACFRFDR